MIFKFQDYKEKRIKLYKIMTEKANSDKWETAALDATRLKS